MSQTQQVQVWLVGVHTFDKKGGFMQSLTFKVSVEGGFENMISSLSSRDQSKLRNALKTKLVDRKTYKVIRKILPSLPRSLAYHTIQIVHAELVGTQAPVN